MATSESTTPKELLTQKEIASLLEIFTTHEPVKEGEVLLEVGISKVAIGLHHYFESLGLKVEEVSVVPGLFDYEVQEAYQSSYEYLSHIYIEPLLGLDLVGTRFGLSARCFEKERELTSLEQRLLAPIYKEISYLVEKELDGHFEKNGLSEGLHYLFKVIIEGVESVMVLDFLPETSNSVQDVNREEYTPMLVSIGTLRTVNIEQNRSYFLDDFGAHRAVLLVDNSAAFLVEHQENGAEALSLELLGPLTDARLFERHHLVIASGLLDDETLLALEYGTVIGLPAYTEVKVYKEGVHLAKAKVYRSEGRLAVRVEDEKL